MSGKNQYPFTANWQSTNPAVGFLPVPPTWGGGSQPSGVTSGTMSGTNTIYTQIFEVSRMDNLGLEFSWSGTPAGAFTVYGSNSGINFFDIGATPVAPTGASGGFLLNLNQYPFKYLMIKYVNASGSGTLKIYGQGKDLN